MALDPKIGRDTDAAKPLARRCAEAAAPAPEQIGGAIMMGGQWVPYARVGVGGENAGPVQPRPRTHSLVHP